MSSKVKYSKISDLVEKCPFIPLDTPLTYKKKVI